jgi:protein involved in polysaccharide export with SLBB domain
VIRAAEVEDIGNAPVTVGDDGAITLPLLGRVQA